MKALRHYFVDHGLWATILPILILGACKTWGSLMNETVAGFVVVAWVGSMLFGIAWPAWFAPNNRIIREKRARIRQQRI